MTAAQIAFYISFCERHLIADDPYDEQTQEFRRQQDPPPTPDQNPDDLDHP